MNFIAKIQEQHNIILASSSPRRKQLLSSIGLKFEIIPPNIDEKKLDNNIFDIPPQNYCQHLAISKAINVYHNNMELQYSKPQIIISADTIVVFENEIINKPKDNNEAILFLKKLSDNKHKVFTGVSILRSNDGKINCHYAETDVYFRKLTNQEIIDYVSTGSPLDKAGGYGIQDDYGCLFVKRINGCYYNVVGLPLQLLYKMLLVNCI